LFVELVSERTTKIKGYDKENIPENEEEDDEEPRPLKKKKKKGIKKAVQYEDGDAFGDFYDGIISL